MIAEGTGELPGSEGKPDRDVPERHELEELGKGPKTLPFGSANVRVRQVKSRQMFVGARLASPRFIVNSPSWT
jgi:hypothetical protein